MISTGLSVLIQEKSALLRGRVIGLVTNATGIDERFRNNGDLIAAQPDCELKALFAPEHGLHAVHQDGHSVRHGTDPRLGIPIYSLYGATQYPDAAMLRGIDTLIYDIQDVGARFYTYISTLACILEAASEHELSVLVLDRPNPLGGEGVAGPLLEPEYRSFVGAGRLPIRHGLTVGELARFLCSERRLSLDLQVIRMRGWHRTMWYDDTGLPWILPSPNMPTLDTATVYPGTCLLEGANVSEGRGTARPFELIGAPWIDAHAFADRLNEEGLPGAHFRPLWFMPMFSKYQGEACGGVQIHVTDREAFCPVATGVVVLGLLRGMYPEEFRWRTPNGIDRLAGTASVRRHIETGTPWKAIVSEWEASLSAFRQTRLAWFCYE